MCINKQGNDLIAIISHKSDLLGMEVFIIIIYLEARRAQVGRFYPGVAKVRTSRRVHKSLNPVLIKKAILV